MLTAEERREIEAEMGHYPDPKAVSIEALKVIQKHRGWVTDEGIRDLAAFLNVTAEDLDGVATFYNLIFRRPVGRHAIFVCNSISCHLLNCQGVIDALTARLGIGLGGTTPDGRFTLLTIPCLGTCDHAPAILIDGDLHRDVDPQRLEAILERYP